MRGNTTAFQQKKNKKGPATLSNIQQALRYAHDNTKPVVYIKVFQGIDFVPNMRSDLPLASGEYAAIMVDIQLLHRTAKLRQIDLVNLAARLRCMPIMVSFLLTHNPILPILTLFRQQI